MIYDIPIYLNDDVCRYLKDPFLVEKELYKNNCCLYLDLIGGYG